MRVGNEIRAMLLFCRPRNCFAFGSSERENLFAALNISCHSALMVQAHFSRRLNVHKRVQPTTSTTTTTIIAQAIRARAMLPAALALFANRARTCSRINGAFAKFS